jgi:hypothetical protein
MPADCDALLHVGTTGKPSEGLIKTTLEFNRMQTITPTTATAKTAKQLVIAVSDRVKTWVKDTAASFSAPSKSKDILAASEREVLDAMIDFVELYRYQQAPTMESVTLNEGTPEETTELVQSHDTDGNPEFHEVDLFEGSIEAVMALRMETTRTNSSTAKLASAEAELAELRAMIAKLQGNA